MGEGLDKVLGEAMIKGGFIIPEKTFDFDGLPYMYSADPRPGQLYQGVGSLEEAIAGVLKERALKNQDSKRP